MNAVLRRYLLSCYYTFVLIVVFLASVVLCMRFLLSQVSNHDIESRLSRWVGTPVHIQDAKVAWSGYKPVIAFDKVAIGQATTAKSPIHVNKLLLSIDLWQTLRYQKIQPKRLFLDKATIGFQLAKDGEFHLTTQTIHHGKQISDDINNFLLWFFRQREANIQDITVNVLYDQVTYPIRLSSIHVLNEGDKHQAVIEAQSVNPENSTFRVVMDLTGKDYDNLSGKLYAKLSSLPLSYMDHHLEFGPVKLSQGVLSSEWWASIESSQLKRVSSDINIDHLALESLDTGKVAKFENFQVALSGDRDSQKGVYDLLFSEGLRQQLYQQRLQVSHPSSGKTTVSMATLPLPLLNQVLDFLIGKKATPFRQLAGELNNLSVAIDANEPLSVSTEFSELSFNSSIVKATNLSGKVSGTLNEGRLLLDNHNGQLSFSDEALVLPFNTLSGLLTWKRGSKGLMLSANELSLQSSDASLVSKFDWLLTDSFSDSELNSQTQFEVTHLERYLSHVSRFNEDKRFLHWLENSVLNTGKITGRLLTKGTITDFVKQQGHGEMNAVVKVNDTTLKYHPEWPIVSNIDARLELSNQQLNGQALTATMGGNVVKQVDFTIEPLFQDKTFLTINSHNNVNTESVLDYLEESPISSKLDLLKEIHVSSPIDAELRLEIPLYKENHVNRIQGVVHLSGQQLSLDKPYFINLNNSLGEVHFNEEGVSDGVVQTTLYGEKLSLRLSHVETPLSGLQIDGQGRFNMATFNQFLPQETGKPLKGVTPYRLSLFVHSKEHMRLNLTSDLGLVYSELPIPLKNTNREPIPVQLTALCEKDNHQLTFALGNRARGKLNFNELQQKVSGLIQLGVNKAPLKINNDQLEIAVQLKKMNLNQWQPYIEIIGKSQGGQFQGNKRLTLHVAELIVGPHLFHDVNIHGRENNGSWTLNLSGRELDGTLVMLKKGSKQVISGHLKKLVLEQRLEERERVEKENLPDIKLTIDNFTVNKAHLGEVKIVAHQATDGYHIDSLDIGDKSYRIHAKGIQTTINDRSRTTLKGYAETINLHALLIAWGINPVVDSKKASIDYQVYWNDKVNAFRLKDLNGSVHLSVKSGRITELNESTEQQLGLGKLISILSLQTIPRRLVLDFSDLQQKGYSFDLAKGSFNIERGKFHTKKLSIDGPVAYVEMSGLVDVPNETYDMSLNVSPHITASLPVVATIAGGPLVGAFTWLASKIVNQSMREVTSYSYYLYGPWLKPTLKQVNILHKRNA